MERSIAILGIILFLSQMAYAKDYWTIDRNDGGITWQIEKGIAHDDHIEMSGKRVSVVLRYGVDAEQHFHIKKSMVWPMLRTIPNNTNASLSRNYNWNLLNGITVNSQFLQPVVSSMQLVDGMLKVNMLNGPVILRASYFPSVDKPALIECYELINHSAEPIVVEIPSVNSRSTTPKEKGVYGSYTILFRSGNATTQILQSNDTLRFSASIAAYKQGENEATTIETLEEWKKRISIVDEWQRNLVLETPSEIINRMFAFSKIRALESIYQTKNGPMHGPGGEAFYAAIWANDEAEYINPYFPFTGYTYGNASALNSFLMFAKYMNDDGKPIPSSIIAEGTDVWNGVGDRGDAAMIAYGASRYALARGSKQEARQLWPLIKWCLSYCRRHLNAAGVVTSNCDELEFRFPAGNANLCTSSLYYDALISATYLCRDLGESQEKANSYRKQASILHSNIEKYFGCNIDGFATYRYYDGNTVLRSWICIPLAMGIFDRAKGTIDALFSPDLWTNNGLLTQAGDKTFWDRSTLYALRGILMAGETDRALSFLQSYSRNRLLGSHVPYAIEAWPEGNQRHLSAESGLYGRIITEGIFGIRPTGLHCFSLSPRLGKDWDHISLRHIRAFGADLNISVKRKGIRYLVNVTNRNNNLLKKEIREGDSLYIKIK